MKFTAVYQKVPEGYIGFVEELPVPIHRGNAWRSQSKYPRGYCDDP